MKSNQVWVTEIKCFFTEISETVIVSVVSKQLKNSYYSSVDHLIIAVLNYYFLFQIFID